MSCVKCIRPVYMLYTMMYIEVHIIVYNIEVFDCVYTKMRQMVHKNVYLT